MAGGAQINDYTSTQSRRCRAAAWTVLQPDPKDQVMGTSEEEDLLAMPTKSPDVTVRWQRIVTRAALPPLTSSHP